VGGIRIGYDEFGFKRLHRAQQSWGVGGGGRDLVAGITQHQGQTFPQEGLVLGDHDTHGISAVTRVPPLRWTDEVQRAAQDVEPVG